MPFATLVHVPRLPVSAQDWQAAPHAELQQTPCAQKPLWHWVPLEQLAPGPDLPQLLLAQRLGDWHWVSAVQALKHLVALQVYGLQLSESGFTQ